MELTRKDVLKLGLLGSAALVFPLEQLTARSGNNRLRRLPDPFRAELPIPPAVKPVRRTSTTDFCEITMKQADVEIIPGMKTRIWGYDGLYPGPTIMARSGRRTVIRYNNELPDWTTVHTHGAYVDGDSDGHPAKFIEPGEHQNYYFGNEQIARTQWYHDHAMHITGPNVYRGLAGFYLIEDDFEDNLPLPKGYGEYDIPLVIQDRLFLEDGSLNYPVQLDDNSANGVFGDVTLVNGKPWPRMEVSARRYRFRILNGANARPYQLALSNGDPFTVIATEGGLLERPIQVRSLPIAQAERYEIVIDFSRYPVGTQIIMKNLLGRRGRKVRRDLDSDEPMAQIMRFDVVRKAREDSIVPSVLRPAAECLDPTHLAPYDASRAAVTRRFVFKRTGGYWTINGKLWDEDRIDADPQPGDTEIWEFENPGGGWVHPVHVHLLNYRILDRNGRPPHPWERGWKDTVFLGTNEKVRVLMTWPKVPRLPIVPEEERTEFIDRYPFHCHNLEHEDHDMMLQFKVGGRGARREDRTGRQGRDPSDDRHRKRQGRGRRADRSRGERGGRDDRKRKVGARRAERRRSIRTGRRHRGRRQNG